MLQKWILHLHLLKFSHQNCLLGKEWMSHQITGLITRTSVLWPLERCLGLLFQQVLGNVQTEQSPPPGDNNIPTRTASGCQEGHTRGLPGPHHHVPYCPVLQVVSCACNAQAGKMLVSVPPRRDLQSKDSPWKTHLPAQLFTISPPCSKDMSRDPQLQATAGRADGQKAPHGGPTSPWSHNVLLLGGQHLIRLISTTTMLLLPASRLPAASAPGDAGF